jgi:hypothetical protein
MSDTIWKPIPGYEKEYKVSNDGRVMALERYTTFKRGTTVVRKRLPQKELTPSKTKEGYRIAELWKGGKRERIYLHILVLRAFHGQGAPNMVGTHIDGDLDNNHADNLAWSVLHHPVHYMNYGAYANPAQ